MNGIQSYHYGLNDLPLELLMHIVELIKDKNSLLSLSSVNQIFQQLCVSHLFQTLKVTFSTAGLDCLIQISNSWIAQYIQVLVYKIPKRIDLCKQTDLDLTHSLPISHSSY